MRRIPIRLKLAAALLVPLVALAAITILEAVTISGDVAEAKDEAETAESMLGPSSLVTMLEHERDAAGVYVIGQEGNISLPVEDNAEARAATDETLAAFREDLREGGELADVYAPALAALDGIDDLRARVDGVDDARRTLDNLEAADTVFTGYTAMMQELFSADRQVARSIDDPDLRRGAELYDLSARQTDAVARLVRDLLLAAVAGPADGLDQPDEVSSVARVLAEVRANDSQIRLTAQGDYEPLADDLYAAEHVVRFPELAATAIETGDVDVAEVMAASTGPDPSSEGYTAFRAEVSDTLRQQADDLRSAADARRVRYLGLALLAVALAVAITWAVSRSITGPLRSLTTQAQDMAGRRLPAAVREILDLPLGDDVVVPETVPIRVKTRDEVADVVDALNTVQESALDLAVEQAVLRRNIADSFVNLGRRNQNLLGRQLDFITELESNETDPDTLASLFRLDHLATRMRRNAESLLVLAGIDPPRKWAAPVRVTDVIRAALGEVEDYQRVALRDVQPATVLGSAAADLAHLVAEFVENALTFSPPDQEVEVYGGVRPEGGYRLGITDAGVGMSDQDLAEANRRLAGAESYTVAPSRYLGHYVAANLAVRHGVTIRLDGRPGNGVVVTIELPPGLLTDEGDLAVVPVPEVRPARAGMVAAGPSAGAPGVPPAGPPVAPAGPAPAAAGSPLDVAGPGLYAAEPDVGAGAMPEPELPARTASGLPIRSRSARPAGVPGADAATSDAPAAAGPRGGTADRQPADPPRDAAAWAPVVDGRPDQPAPEPPTQWATARPGEPAPEPPTQWADTRPGDPAPPAPPSDRPPEPPTQWATARPGERPPEPPTQWADTRLGDPAPEPPVGWTPAAPANGQPNGLAPAPPAGGHPGERPPEPPARWADGRPRDLAPEPPVGWTPAAPVNGQPNGLAPAPPAGRPGDPAPEPPEGGTPATPAIGHTAPGAAPAQEPASRLPALPRRTRSGLPVRRPNGDTPGPAATGTPDREPADPADAPNGHAPPLPPATHTHPAEGHSPPTAPAGPTRPADPAQTPNGHTPPPAPPGPAAGPAAAPPPLRTRSGLPVRRPNGRPPDRPSGPAHAGSGDATQARVRAQDDLLVALRAHAGPRPDTTSPPAARNGGPGTTGATGPTRTNGGLTRRVPGAQLPDTSGPRIRRGPGRGDPTQDDPTQGDLSQGDPAPPTAAEGPGAADQQLYDLLERVTGGRREHPGPAAGDDPGPDPHPGPPHPGPPPHPQG